MLPKKYRLSEEKDVLRVLRRGRKAARESFNFWKLRNATGGNSRFVFLVSKKISNKANKRNLVKRRMRHIVGKNLKNAAPGFDYVFSAKPSILKKPYGDLSVEIYSVLTK